MDVTEAFRRAVRSAIGLADPQLPMIDRLAFYEATVKVAASDGKTVDIEPTDKRFKPMQGVKLKTGIPGAVAIVEPGAIVMLGWEGGNPGLPYVFPLWADGATVIKLVLKAQMVYLGDEAGADSFVKKSEFNGHSHDASNLLCTGGTVSGSTGGAPPATGTTKVKGV